MTSRRCVACMVFVVVLIAAGTADAQTGQPRARAAPLPAATLPAPPSPTTGSDPVWEGLLIGGAAGAIGGMIIAPPLFCGHNDPECAAIVRVAIGLPSIAG